MSTTTDRIVAFLHAAALAVALVVVGVPAPAAAHGPAASESASPPAAPAPTAAPAEPAPSSAAPTSVEAALEAGDLETAMTLATEARTKDPSPAAWRVEAEVAELRGDLAAAEAAYRGELEALPKGDAQARARAEQDLARVQAQSRGTVASEPKSQHRAELDRKWAGEPKAAASPKKRRTVPPPSPRAREDRIVTKWYFWVTVGAIVASAAAVTAIAIRAARDDEPDALGLEAGPRSMGATLLRF